MKKRKTGTGSQLVRLPEASFELVQGWAALTGLSSSKVAALFIQEAAKNPDGESIRLLKREAAAVVVLATAKAKAAAIRRGKGGAHEQGK